MLVFVYGTLKRGYRLHHHLADQSFVCEAETVSQYRLVKLGWYPGLVRSATNQGVCVQGEVWNITDECLVVLDAVEEVDSGLYERGPIQLMQMFESPVHAWFYLGDIARAPDCGASWHG